MRSDITLKITSEQKKVDKEIHMEALTFVKVLGLLPNPFGLFGLFPSVPPFCVKSPVHPVRASGQVVRESFTVMINFEHVFLPSSCCQLI